MQTLLDQFGLHISMSQSLEKNSRKKKNACSRSLETNILLLSLNTQVFLPAYICVCYVSAWCLVVSSRTPVTDSYKSPCGSLKEQPVLLTAESTSPDTDTEK